MTKGWNDKKKGFVSNLFPPLAKNVSFFAAQSEEAGQLDQSFGFFGGIRILRFGLHEKIYQYKPDGSFVVPGDPNPDGLPPTPLGEVCPPTASIGYTTRQPAAGEEQVLVPISGSGGSGNPPYTWSNEGGGSVSPEGVYTAPTSNMGCSYTSIVSLRCGDQVMDNMSFSVNMYTDDDAWAYSIYSECEYYSYGANWCDGLFVPSEGGSAIAVRRDYNCEGDEKSCGAHSAAGCPVGDTSTCMANCAAAVTITGTVDKRSPAMTAAGCCPSELY